MVTLVTSGIGFDGQFVKGIRPRDEKHRHQHDHAGAMVQDESGESVDHTASQTASTEPNPPDAGSITPLFCTVNIMNAMNSRQRQIRYQCHEKRLKCQTFPVDQDLEISETKNRARVRQGRFPEGCDVAPRN